MSKPVKVKLLVEFEVEAIAETPEPDAGTSRSVAERVAGEFVGYTTRVSRLIEGVSSHYIVTIGGVSHE